jgi:hypothetical protein
VVRAKERLVVLDEAWIEQHELRARRESAARIIERDADAEAIEFFNYLQGARDVEQRHTLRDLDDEAPGRKSARARRSSDLRDETVVMKLAGRQIDRDVRSCAMVVRVALRIGGAHRLTNYEGTEFKRGCFVRTEEWRRGGARIRVRDGANASKPRNPPLHSTSGPRWAGSA